MIPTVGSLLEKVSVFSVHLDIGYILEASVRPLILFVISLMLEQAAVLLVILGMWLVVGSVWRVRWRILIVMYLMEIIVRCAILVTTQKMDNVDKQTHYVIPSTPEQANAQPAIQGINCRMVTVR